MRARWNRTLDVADVFRGDAPFPERRDEMVRRVRLLDPLETDGDLQDIADGLAEAEDVDEWDGPWDDFYVWADYHRVWVKTR
jgi:hypothetical protein